MLTYNLQTFLNFFQIFLQSHSTMQRCWNAAFFKVREDHQESSALQQLHPAHLPSTVEKEAFKKVCCCYFSCCCLRKKKLICTGSYPQFQKIHSLHQNKIHLRCIIPKINPNQPFQFPRPLHIREALEKNKLKHIVYCEQIILLGIRNGYVVCLAHLEQ